MDDFAAAIEAAKRDVGCKGIGTMGEKSLHLTMKYYFAPDSDQHEIPLGNFVADAVTDDGIIEVQTRSLARLKPKLRAFLQEKPVTVVYPIAAEKQLIRVSNDGEIIGQRKSPKHETIFTAMREIYALREFLQQPNFRICVAELSLNEYILDGARGRSKRLDREPIALNQLYMLESAADYIAILPQLPEQVTAAMLAKALHVPVDSARRYLNILQSLSAAEEIGRQGSAKIWRILQKE